MWRPIISIHAYIHQKAGEASPQLHITTEEQKYNEGHIHHKEIKIKQQEIIKLLQEKQISQEKILWYLEYCILSTIGRMKKNRENNYRYKDVMDIIYNQKLDNKRNSILVQPLYKMFQTHTDELPPNSAIRVRIWRREKKKPQVAVFLVLKNKNITFTETFHIASYPLWISIILYGSLSSFLWCELSLARLAVCWLRDLQMTEVEKIFVVCW